MECVSLLCSGKSRIRINAIFLESAFTPSYLVEPRMCAKDWPTSSYSKINLLLWSVQCYTFLTRCRLYRSCKTTFMISLTLVATQRVVYHLLVEVLGPNLKIQRSWIYCSSAWFNVLPSTTLKCWSGRQYAYCCFVCCYLCSYVSISTLTSNGQPPLRASARARKEIQSN